MQSPHKKRVLNQGVGKKCLYLQDWRADLSVYSRPSPTERQLIPVAFVSEKWFEISCWGPFTTFGLSPRLHFVPWYVLYFLWLWSLHDVIYDVILTCFSSACVLTRKSQFLRVQQGYFTSHRTEISCRLVARMY